MGGGSGGENYVIMYNCLRLFDIITRGCIVILLLYTKLDCPTSHFYMLLLNETKIFDCFRILLLDTPP